MRKETSYEVSLTVTLRVAVDDTEFEKVHLRRCEGIDVMVGAQEAVLNALRLAEQHGFVHQFADYTCTSVLDVEVDETLPITGGPDEDG